VHPYPHRYRVAASGSASGLVAVSATDLPTLDTAPPPEFDGPGGKWSPETLLCAAVADCFILTFRAVSRAANLTWSRLECHVEGTLERVAGNSLFTQFATSATLTVAPGTDPDKARSLLERAEHGCLIANSLKGARTLEAHVVIQGVP
jgi:organic hydroperoxide reductase OsmC/OhrA